MFNPAPHRLRDILWLLLIELFTRRQEEKPHEDRRTPR